MGSRNIETVEAAIELFNRAETDEVFDRFAAEDVAWDYTRTVAPDGGGVYEGIDAAKRFARQLFVEPWEKVEFIADELVEVGEDRVVVSSHTRNVGRDGIEVVARGALLVEFRDDGKFTALRLFQSEEEALEFARADR